MEFRLGRLRRRLLQDLEEFHLRFRYRYVDLGNAQSGDLIGFDGTNPMYNPMEFRHLTSNDFMVGPRLNLDAFRAKISRRDRNITRRRRNIIRRRRPTHRRRFTAATSQQGLAHSSGDVSPGRFQGGGGGGGGVGGGVGGRRGAGLSVGERARSRHAGQSPSAAANIDKSRPLSQVKRVWPVSARRPRLPFPAHRATSSSNRQRSRHPLTANSTTISWVVSASATNGAGCAPTSPPTMVGAAIIPARRAGRPPAHVETLTTLLNGYFDLGTWAGITPYIGAGSWRRIRFLELFESHDRSPVPRPPLLNIAGISLGRRRAASAT